MIEGGPTDLTETDSDSDSFYQIYDIDAMTSWMIVSVKVALIQSRNVSEKKEKVQDVPQTKTFQSKGRHSTVSPEELSLRWQIGIEQARETIRQNNKNTHLIICNAPSEAIQGGHSVPD